MGRPALFLDRDGVVNEDFNFVYRAAEVEFVPGIFSLCRTAQELGYAVVIVTNQSGIGRGLYTTAEFEELMEWMRGEFRREGVEVTAVYHCPFHPKHGLGEFKREHEDRKPEAGMLRRARLEHGVSLEDSVMIGDRCSDIGAANAAGCRQAFLISGTETVGCGGSYLGVESLGEVEAWLLARG